MINVTEFFGRILAQSIKGFPGLSEKAGVILGHRMADRPAVNRGGAGVEKTFDSGGGRGFQEMNVAPDILPKYGRSIIGEAPGEMNNGLFPLDRSID